MIGGISATMIGLPYKGENISSKNFPLFSTKSTFTGDTVMKIAIADSLLRNIPFVQNIRYWGRKYLSIGYTKETTSWIQSDSNELLEQITNGSATRVSPIGFAFSTPDEVLEIAKQSAILTHNTKEGITGAQAIALCIFWANLGMNKDFIYETICDTFHYNLSPSISSLRNHITTLSTKCSQTVPHAIIAFLNSTSYEDTIRNAISIGGDSNTIACMAGDIAAAYYKEIPNYILYESYMRLPQEFIDIIVAFHTKYTIKICPI